MRALEKWVLPYVKSRTNVAAFRPLLSYLFTDWRCNMACSYCYTHDNRIEGMTFDTARRAIDWLRTTGCRVVAIMGGEPLLRKDFVVEVIGYGVRQGFFMYLPTNGLLLDADFVDRVGRAGVAAVNVAVDCIDPRPGLPKALSRIEPQLDYLIRQRERYGYLVFLNVNITARNMDDVRRLTEAAHVREIAVDYHVNEPPHVDQPQYRGAGDDTYIRSPQWEEFDALVDWLAARALRGQLMINTAAHLRAMKSFVRGRAGGWGCRAGHNSSAVRIDGTLSPCFGLYSLRADWGSIGAPRFDAGRLAAMKQQCQSRCLSTCQFNLARYYSPRGMADVVYRHASAGGRRLLWRTFAGALGGVI